MHTKLLYMLLFVLSAPAVTAKTIDSTVIEGVGLDGRWAQSCNRPASADNPYLIYTAPDVGQPTERRVAPPDEDRVTELLDIQWKKTRELVWVIAEGEVMLTIVSKLEGNRMRVCQCHRPTGSTTSQRGLVKTVSPRRGSASARPTERGLMSAFGRMTRGLRCSGSRNRR